MAETGDTLGSLLCEARSALRRANVDDAGLDARLLVEHLTGTDRSQALVAPERPVGKDVARQISQAVARRIAGTPVHRILGVRSFYGLELKLSPATLEPRPDTETLVDAMLPFVRETLARTGTCRILDLGTGTGAIALALLAQAPKAMAMGVDISREALDMAWDNAGALGLRDRFSVLESDWFQAVTGVWDAIVSNPPYIKKDEIAALSREVRDHDPILALDGGRDGLDAYRRIASEAGPFLQQQGRIGVEIGFDQRKEVGAVFGECGFSLDASIHDLAGNDRVMIFKNA